MDSSSPGGPRQDWIVKSNDLVNARYDWTTLQQRLVLLMIAQLDPADEDFGIQRIDIADLVDRSGLSSKAYYERAAEAAGVLLDQKIYVRTEGSRWRGYNLLSFVEPHPGHILARFNPDMRPFLLQLRQRFTRYMLGHILRFQSPYSVRIYEMAMQFQDIGHRTILLDDLREILDVVDKYPRFYDFRRRILDQAVREIGTYTDHVVTYDIVKKGRVPNAVRLHIRERTGAEQAARPASSSGAPTARPSPTDASQSRLDFAPKVEGDTPDERAFRAWWRSRTEAEQVAAETEARDRLDPFIRKLDAASPAARLSLRESLLDVWRERTAAEVA